MDWEFETSLCKQSYMEWINKVLSYSTGNCIWYHVIHHNGKEKKILDQKSPKETNREKKKKPRSIPYAGTGLVLNNSKFLQPSILQLVLSFLWQYNFFQTLVSFWVYFLYPYPHATSTPNILFQPYFFCRLYFFSSELSLGLSSSS